MKVLIIVLILFFGETELADEIIGDNTRYIMIEAPCKPGFKALPDSKEKVIITNIFKVEFENAFELVNAEPELIVDFEVALENAFPNSRNQIEDILVYMMTTEKEAKDLYKRKRKQFQSREIAVIELKLN